MFKSLLRLILSNLEKGNPIWRFPEENITVKFSQIWNESTRLAKICKKLGIERQDRVGVLLNNCSTYIPILLAIWRCNAIIVPLRTRQGKFINVNSYLGRVDKDCQFRLILFDDKVENRMLEKMRNISQTGALHIGEFLHCEGIEGDMPLPEILPDDLAVIQYSSGSTGHPKGVIVTHRMVIFQVKELVRELIKRRGCTEIRSMASWLPFYHDMGLFMGIFVPLYTFSQNMLSSPRYYMTKPNRWFTMMNEQCCNVHVTTNTAMKYTIRALKRLSNADLDLSQLYIYLGAEKVFPKVVRGLISVLSPLNVGANNISVGYGMTENTLTAVSTPEGPIKIVRFRCVDGYRYVPVEDDNHKSIELVSVGTPHSGVMVTVRDNEGHVLPELSLGEICIEGPCVMPGYYNNDVATKLALDGRILRTADQGFFYKGELFFLSRKDDLIIVGGSNIDPEDVETSIEELPFIRRSALVSIETDDRQKLVLLAEYNGQIGHQGTEEKRIILHKKIMEDFELLVNEVHFCQKDDIELTSSGKKRRKSIVQRFENNELKVF